jgi:glycosyltransferase involved in cell wall biosynthesis
VFSPPPALSRRQTAWLRAVDSVRPLHVVCPTATLRRICVERGLPIDRVHLIRPGVDFSKIRRRRSAEFRTALGFSDADFVLLAAGESTPNAAHRDAVWAAAILNFLDPRYKLLLWGRGGQTDALRRFAERLGQPDAVRFAERLLGRSLEFEDLMPAVDAALVPARGAVAILPVAICMAAGLPIVANVTYTVSELLEDRHTAVMCAKRSPKAMAQKLLELRGDSSLQWSITDRARTEAYEYFSVSRFLREHREMYQRIVESRTRVVALESEIRSIEIPRA